MYVLKRQGTRWHPIFHRGDLGSEEPDGIRSIVSVTEDWDQDGVPEILVAGADQHMHRFVVSEPDIHLRPARWVKTYALNEAEVLLAWKAIGADSVVVYRSAEGLDFDRLGVSTETQWIDPVTEPHRYSVQAWYAGVPAQLAPPRLIRPHPSGCDCCCGIRR